MKTQHTPGPWNVVKKPSMFIDDLEISIDMIDTKFGPICKVIGSRHNASLIAEAPGMLEELEKAHEIILVMLNALPDRLKPSVAKKLYERGIADDGMTRSHERESVIRKAKGL